MGAVKRELMSGAVKQYSRIQHSTEQPIRIGSSRVAFASVSLESQSTWVQLRSKQLGLSQAPRKKMGSRTKKSNGAATACVEDGGGEGNDRGGVYEEKLEVGGACMFLE